MAISVPQIHKPHAPLDYESWRKVLANERLPAAVVDLDAFDRNVAHFASLLRAGAGVSRLRPATKSIRVPELMRRILASGAPYQGLMCYAAQEAAWLAEQGFDDLLVAYPTVQPADIAALRLAQERGATARLVVDSLPSVERIASQVPAGAAPLPVVLEVDMSLRMLGGRIHLGVRRSPVRTVEQVVEFFAAAGKLRGVRVAGIMGYEAQVAGLGDRNPFKKWINPIAGWIRRASMRSVARLREQIQRALEQRGETLELFNGGGTGSITSTALEPWLTEATVGSGFLCSHLFDYYSNVRSEPACFFALQVVRKSDAGYATCLGGGFIASGEPGWDKVPRPYLPAGLKLVSTEGCGEVQTPLLVPESQSLEPGAPVLFRHAKAGELAEHFDEYLLVSDGEIVGRAPTYRGLGLCFIG
jgi:D-serine deaminase-like pyridoxal phosphate-dependent protein